MNAELLVRVCKSPILIELPKSIRGYLEQNQSEIFSYFPFQQQTLVLGKSLKMCKRVRYECICLDNENDSVGALCKRKERERDLETQRTRELERKSNIKKVAKLKYHGRY